MTLTLRIENFDQLPDGGPVSYTVDQAGFEIGRAQHLDWTLPDPERLISGHHVEVRFDGNTYQLHDVSRNGTLLNGATTRMKSPYQLAHGDRLQIGHYIIVVEIAQGPASAVNAYSDPAPSSENIWDMGGSAPAPVDRREFKQDQRAANRAPDFANQHLDLPVYSEPTPAPGESPFGSQQQPAPQPQPQPQPMPQAAPPAAHQAAVEAPAQPGGRGWQPPFQGETFGGAAAAPAPAAAPIPTAQPAHQASVPPTPIPAPAAPVAVPTPAAAAPEPAPSADGAVDARLFFAAMAEAAGVPVETFTARAPIDVAQEIGEVLRCSTDELTNLLKARAAAKKLAKSSDRTMISASDNNAMKFIPSAAEAMEVMFAHNRPGYMSASESFKASFEDLKKHEYATYSAMQRALSRLLEGLSPEAIEGKIKSGVMGSKKAKAWEIFVERWDAQTEPHENGMLDVFLSHFAEAYDEAARD